MKNWKIVIVTTTIAILAVATISLSFAHNLGGSPYYGGMMGYPDYDGETEDWWTEMREYMGDHWDEVQDEEWFDEMRTYMDEHLDDVENQEWFDEMTEYMEEQRFDNNYRYGYHGCH